MNALRVAPSLREVLAIVLAIVTIAFNVGYHFFLQKYNNPEGE